MFCYYRIPCHTFTNKQQRTASRVATESLICSDSMCFCRHHVAEVGAEQLNRMFKQDHWELVAWRTSTFALLASPAHHSDFYSHQFSVLQQQMHNVSDLDNGAGDGHSSTRHTGTSPYARNSTWTAGASPLTQKCLSSQELALQGASSSSHAVMTANDKVTLGVCIGAGEEWLVRKLHRNSGTSRACCCTHHQGATPNPSSGP